jgi:hypothetical protein
MSISTIIKDKLLGIHQRVMGGVHFESKIRMNCPSSCRVERLDMQRKVGAAPNRPSQTLLQEESSSTRLQILYQSPLVLVEPPLQKFSQQITRTLIFGVVATRLGT